MVERPVCYDDEMDEIAGGFGMWNEAFNLGGPACTIRQVEQLTGIYVDHFVVVDFNGFKGMVDALDGVKVCIPADVNYRSEKRSVGKECVSTCRSRWSPSVDTKNT